MGTLTPTVVDLVMRLQGIREEGARRALLLQMQMHAPTDEDRCGC
jgi:hypothetical protein